MNPVSLTITIVFIGAILWMTIAGFWPFIKAFGLSGLVFFWKTAEHLKKNIEEAIQKLPEESSIEDQRNAFAKQYNEINDYFTSDQSVFSHLWLEFTEQLIEPSDKEPVFQNSIRPEKFFTLEHCLKQKNINLKLLESKPGILVGMGVLGTFVGLSISLILALDKLQGDPSEAVEILISWAGVAFLTSVAGLLCSLFFNVVSDKKISGLQIQLNKFNSLLEKSLKFVTKEYLLVKSLEESQQQGRHLANMDERIASKIGDIIATSVKQMGREIQQVISQSNQNISEEFLKNIANQMTQGMGDFASKQMENMEKILSSLRDNIPPLISRLEQSQKQNEEAAKTFIIQLAESGKNSQDQINKSLLDAMRDMKGAFEEITQNLKQGMNQALSDSSKELKELLSNVSETIKVLLTQTGKSQESFKQDIDQTTNKLHNFADRLDQAFSELRDTEIPKIQSAFNTFKEAAEQQKQIVEKNEDYVLALDKLSEELRNMSLSVSEAIQEFPGFIENIKQSNESLQKIWSDYEQRFLNVDESAKTLFENISEGLSSVSRRSAEYISNLYKQSEQVSASFSQAVEDLQEAISALNEIVDKLKDN